MRCNALFHTFTNTQNKFRVYLFVYSDDGADVSLYCADTKPSTLSHTYSLSLLYSALFMAHHTVHVHIKYIIFR